MVRIFIFIALYLFSIVISFAQIQSSEILIKNGIIELPGTLTCSDSAKDLIIWIHGSGNIDRNGNQASLVKANYIQQFKDEIIKHDIAFFSYDKRTSNAMNMALSKNDTLVFDDYVADAEKVVSYFKEKKQFDRIILIGHSQGSLVSMLISKNADKLVSLAGLGERVDRALIRQLSKQNKQFGQIAEQYFKELEEKGSIKEVSPFLMSVFAEQNQPFLKNWMKYDPIKEIKKVTIPVLIINGTSDSQVRVEDAKALLKSKSDARLVVIDSMNHLLKIVKNRTEDMNAYVKPDFPLSEKLIKEIVTFVKE